MNGVLKIILPILIVAQLVIGFVWTQHTAWTEMLVYPYLLNNGFVLYQDLIAPYTPIFLWILQIITSIFGYTPQISLFTTAVLAVINSLIIYWIVKKKTNQSVVAYLATLFYAGWFFYFEGNGLWFEIFQVHLILLAYYFMDLFLFARSKIIYFVAACILISIAFFTKQSAMWLIFGLVGYLLFTKQFKGLKTYLILQLVTFFLVGIIVLGLCFLMGYGWGFIDWAFGYTFFYFPLSPGHTAYPAVDQLLKLGIPLLVLAPLIIYLDRRKLLLIAFLGATFMAALPRWGLFHLQPFVAILAISSIYFWEYLIKANKITRVAMLFIITIWVVVIVRQEMRFLNLPIRFFEPEIYKLADQINTQDYWIINGPDQAYVLNQHIPKVKPYVQNFAWYFEYADLQQQVIEGIQESCPRVILYSPFSDGQGVGVGQYRPNQLAEYILNTYDVSSKLENNYLLLKPKNENCHP